MITGRYTNSNKEDEFFKASSYKEAWDLGCKKELCRIPLRIGDLVELTFQLVILLVFLFILNKIEWSNNSVLILQALTQLSHFKN